MAGLLYKDFAAVKGKLYVIAGVAILLFYIILRFAMPNELGDIFLVTGLVNITTCAFFVILFILEIKLLETDEGRKQKNYFLSLPVTKKQYVASKYIFILIAFYAVLSLGLLLSYICNIDCQSEDMLKLLSGYSGLLPMLVCAFLVVPAIELPFFIIWGSQRGKQIKTGLVMGIFFVIVVYLLFGDLTILDKISVMQIMEYLEKHPDTTMILQVVTPYVSFLLYYLSYRISYAAFARREREDD